VVIISVGLCYLVSSSYQDQRADQEDELNRKLMEYIPAEAGGHD